MRRDKDFGEVRIRGKLQCLFIGFGAVVLSNLKLYQEVNKIHCDIKIKLDDIVNDINDINNQLIDDESQKKLHPKKKR
jgi:predicted RNA-binding protein with PIN domain